MSIYVACQCGQAFSAIADLAGQTLPCPSCGRPLSIPLPFAVGPAAPLVASPAYAPAATARQRASGRLLDRSTLPFVVVGVIGGLAAIGVVAGLAAWLLWDPLVSSDEVARRPSAEARTDSAPSNAAPRREERPSRLPHRKASQPDDRSAAAASTGGSNGQTYRSDDGAVEFWLPAGAKSETQRSFGTSAGVADRTRITWGRRSSGELVGTVYLYRGRHDDLAEDTRMKVGISRDLYRTYGSRVSQSYRDITHAEFTGTEAAIQVPGQRDNTLRFLYTGNYLVTLEATGPPGFAASASAQKFFGSLRLVTGK